MKPLVEIKQLTKQYGTHQGLLTAVHDLNLNINKGEILGLAGESGCGKSTVGQCLLKLTRPSSGAILYDGKPLEDYQQTFRRRVQMIFQDPYSSLNPMMRIGEIVGEPLIIHGIAKGKARREKVQDLLVRVGLEPSMVDRYPHEFSGGQRQRIGIARALAVEPEFLVCDESVSALDATIQRQILTFFQQLQQEQGLTYLWISHDLAVMQDFAHRIAVMYLGRLMELGPANELFRHPLHPYTRALSSAIPIADPKLERKRTRLILQGDPPSPLHPPSGCVFHTRCPYATQVCQTSSPSWKEVSPGRFTACHLIA